MRKFEIICYDALNGSREYVLFKLENGKRTEEILRTWDRAYFMRELQFYID